MMDRTDRHFRFFLRQITRRSLLYTEMITTGALLHGDRDHLLAFDPSERPLALQLGGDDPRALATCAVIARDWGYDEVNLNVGCPSDRVQKGRFGACLMAEPEVVARAVEAMRSAVDLPVTVKHRLGIDNLDTDEHLHHFVATVARAGCDRFSVHARKAWLQGLSPKENRRVPPLQYSRVYRLKEMFRDLEIEINGGIRSLEECDEHLHQVDAVMIGRGAYEDPFFLAAADARLFAAPDPPPSRREVVHALLPYVEDHLTQGRPLGHVTRHILGLFAGRPGARSWRRTLSENAHLPGVGPELLLEALGAVPAEVADERPTMALAAIPRTEAPEGALAARS